MKVWTTEEGEAWYRVYYSERLLGREYYFSNYNGLKRCLEEAKAGVPRAEKVWALYIAERMRG